MARGTAASPNASQRPRRRIPFPRARRAPVQKPLEHRLLQTATFCLLAGGAVMVYSASSARTLLENGGDGTGYLIKYLAYGTLGVVVMHLIAATRLDRVRKATPLLLLAAFVLLVAVLIPGLGVTINGARRWLGVGPLQFQPSEIMKLALVLHVAHVIAQRPKMARTIKGLGGPVLLVGGGGIGLILLQPDLGTSLVISFTMAALIVTAGLPMRQFALLAGVGAVLVLVYALLEPYRRARLTAFADPFAHLEGPGFQSAQGLIALGSGGLLGLGPGESVQKLFYLPEAHTDFILAVIGEELGVAGICVLLALYGMIGYAGLRTARNAKGAYAKLVATGLTSLILCQALLNCYAVLGLAPLTGVPLPFISSGSSSLIVLLCSMGVLLNIANGGSAHLREVPRTRRTDDEGADRRGRDRGTRRPGDRGRGRAAG